MGLILLEALVALFIFIAIVWWTMFSGRSKGELPQALSQPETPVPEGSPSHASSASEDKLP